MADSVNLTGKPGKGEDMAAELARLREENAKLQAKRDNDERSAFGRLEKEAEQRRKVEQEAAEMRRKIAELEAKNAYAALPPDSAEALGEAGVRGIRTLLDSERERFAQAIPLDKFATIEARLEAAERQQLEQASFLKRQSYNSILTSWAASAGMPGLFTRLAPGGDLSEKWAQFAAARPGVQVAFESCDTEGTKDYVQLFLYANPGLQQAVASPSQSGGFAAPLDPNAYTIDQWRADTRKLDEDAEAGRITMRQHAEGTAAATAKLAASEQRR